MNSMLGSTSQRLSAGGSNSATKISSSNVGSGSSPSISVVQGVIRIRRIQRPHLIISVCHFVQQGIHLAREAEFGFAQGIVACSDADVDMGPAEV